MAGWPLQWGSLAREADEHSTLRAWASPQIFAGSFGGATLYDNPDYVSPNAVRASIKRQVRKAMLRDLEFHTGHCATYLHAS